eukprot:SAG22_NODE_574_length_8996_cov_12.163875_3_plen_105_part_00
MVPPWFCQAGGPAWRAVAASFCASRYTVRLKHTGVRPCVVATAISDFMIDRSSIDVTPGNAQRHGKAARRQPWREGRSRRGDGKSRPARATGVDRESRGRPGGV